MGIAYSPKDTVIHAEFPAHSSRCIRSGLHDAFLLAGWQIDRKIEKGYVYVVTSPQDSSLQCKVKVQDNGRRFYGYGGVWVVDVTWMDMTEEYESIPFALKYVTWASGEPEPRRLRVHVGPCQMFTYYPGGVTGSANTVMGGIPFIDPNTIPTVTREERCADEDNEIKTTAAWWCCGDSEVLWNVYGPDTLRTMWTPRSYATLYNEELVKTDTAEVYHKDPLLRLLVINRSDSFWPRFGNSNDDYALMMRWMGTEEPLDYDPLIAWNTEHPVKVRGQLWDSFIRPKYAEWESPLTFDEVEWFSYSCGDHSNDPPHVYETGDVYTLYLRDPGLTMIDCGGNYAY